MPKILIIRFSSIGDIVLTTPVIRCIKQQLKDAEVHYATKEAFKGILNINPFIDKLITMRKSVWEIIPDLKNENYDYVIDLHHNLRSSIIKTQLHTTAYSFSKLNVKKFLATQFKINNLPDIHIVDRYLETVKYLGITNDHKGLDFFISPENEVLLSSLPVSHQKGYIGFVIGAKFNTKQLPVEKIIRVCRQINRPIVLLGGKEDRERGNIIVKACGTNVLNLCGNYNLQQSASLVRQADKIISHDTGLMHIAAAFKKDIVSVWGNTVPEFGMYPYLAGKQSKIIEVKNLSCRPCSKIGYAKCPKKHFDCMNKVEEKEIVRAVC